MSGSDLFNWGDSMYSMENSSDHDDVIPTLIRVEEEIKEEENLDNG